MGGTLGLVSVGGILVIAAYFLGVPEMYLEVRLRSVHEQVGMVQSREDLAAVLSRYERIADRLSEKESSRLGRAVGAQVYRTGGAALACPRNRAACVVGYARAAVESGGLGTVAAVISECALLDSWSSNSCVRGLGEALLRTVGREHLVDALLICTSGSLPGTLLESCFEGIFRTYNFFEAPESPENVRTLDQGNPFVPCVGDIPVSSVHQCVFSLPLWWLVELSREGVGEEDRVRRVGAWCDSLTDISYKDDCMRGIEFAIGYDTSVPTIQRLCSLLSGSRAVESCIENAATRLARTLRGAQEVQEACASGAVEGKACNAATFLKPR